MECRRGYIIRETQKLDEVYILPLSGSSITRSKILSQFLIRNRQRQILVLTNELLREG
jgi:hypothetical protein